MRAFAVFSGRVTDREGEGAGQVEVEEEEGAAIKIVGASD